MPQETKSMPINPDEMEVSPGFAHENLEGWVPPLASDEEIRTAFEKAFDFRGDITLTRKDDSKIEGYLFDRNSKGRTLAECYVRIIPKNSDERVKVPYSEVARIEFTGKDTAAGKSFETWVRKYREKKAAGETNIGLEPEKLD